MNYKDLAEFNKLKNPNLIYTNQVLQIPDKEMAKEEVKTLTILGTADLHGRIYPFDYAMASEDKDAGVAKIATLVKEERKRDPDALLLDCGDTVQDNSALLFNDEKVHPMIKALNAIGTDVWSVGNHEFNFDRAFLDRNIKGFKGKAVLATNIYKKGTENRWLEGYHVFDIKGVRVAVIGLVAPNVPIWDVSHYEKDYGDLSFAKK